MPATLSISTCLRTAAPASSTVRRNARAAAQEGSDAAEHDPGAGAVGIVVRMTAARSMGLGFSQGTAGLGSPEYVIAIRRRDFEGGLGASASSNSNQANTSWMARSGAAEALASPTSRIPCSARPSMATRLATWTADHRLLRRRRRPRQRAVRSPCAPSPPCTRPPVVSSAQACGQRGAAGADRVGDFAGGLFGRVADQQPADDAPADRGHAVVDLEELAGALHPGKNRRGIRHVRAIGVPR